MLNFRGVSVDLLKNFLNIFRSAGDFTFYHHRLNQKPRKLQKKTQHRIATLKASVPSLKLT